MDEYGFDAVFHEITRTVIQRLLNDDLHGTFPNFLKVVEEHVQELPEWQIAFPVQCCQIAGGSIEDGITVANAWALLFIASELFDRVEDEEFIPNSSIPSPEASINLATSLILAAFHTISTIQNSTRIGNIIQIFSSAGFNAAIGQQKDLLEPASSVEEALNQYWETIILKSGSVFHAAATGGAAAGTGDQSIVENLGDYGTALGVMLQILDDCRDAMTDSQEAVEWEVSLPLLLYLMVSGEDQITFPKVNSKAEWSHLLKESGVIHAISSILLEWKNRALLSLEPIQESKEKLLLTIIPSQFLEKIPSQR